MLVLGAGLGGQPTELSAQPARGGGRDERSQLAPDERDRLRRDLRERGFEGWPNQAPRRGRDDPGRQRHLSEEERRQLRRQLREAEGRRR